MSRFRMFRFAAISWLPLFSMVAAAQAQIPFTSNLATDWLSTYPTTTAMAAAHTASWGNAANTGGTSIWSAGAMSYNWTNVESSTYYGVNYEATPTYYLASTGYATSGATQIATYTYTIPFQTYQYNVGQTNQVAVAPSMTQQITSKLATPGGGAVTLPAGWTVTSNPTVASHTYGTIQQIGAVKELSSSEQVQGFTTTGWSASSSFSSGSQTIASTVPGVFYNYSTNVTSGSLAALNVPSSATNTYAGTTYQTVTMSPTLGPTYVAWTSPATGTININLHVWDTGYKVDDGTPSFYVTTSTAGPTAPLLQAINTIAVTEGNYNPFTGNMSATIGTLSALTGMSGYTTGYGLSWQSGNLSVTSGEVLYFIADPGHTYFNGHSYSSYQGGQDPVAVSDIIKFTPEPSSFALMGAAGVGLALAAWRRRRSA